MSCGVCEVACPFDALHIEIGRLTPVPNIDSCKCKDCGRCLKGCPGIGINLEEYCFGESNNIEVTIAGKVLESYTGYSANNDLRYKASSGGMVTSFLIYLLNKHIIDGAVVTTFLPSEKRSKSFLARTTEEFINAKGSKYVVTSLHEGLNELRIAPNGNYVVVALPCQVQGLRKLMQFDRNIKEKIIGIFGLYCSVNKTTNSIEYYYRRWKINPVRFIFRTDGYLGSMKMDDGRKIVKVKYEDYWHGTHSFFVNERCAVCKDHFAELADVSFGDINIPPYNQDEVGINSIIVRSSLWQNHLNQAADEGYILLDKIALNNIIHSQSYATFYKKGVGLQATLRIYKRLGRKIPDFSFKEMRVPIKETIRQLISMTMRKVGRHKSFFFLVSMLDHSTLQKV